MNLHRGFEIYNADGKEITYQELNQEAAEFWDDVIKIGDSIHCIYTGREIHIGNYAVDHFMPWSFVAHDQLWNLVPADNSINSSKSDKLPPLDRYLQRMAEEHRKAIKIYLEAGKKKSALDDFSWIYATRPTTT